MAKTISKRQKVQQARESVESVWQMLGQCKGDLHRIAGHGANLNSDKDKQIIGWCVTACIVEISCRAVEKITNNGMGAN